MRTRHLPVLFLCATTLLIGCQSDDAPSARDRQEQALRDPFGYGPDVGTVDQKRDDHYDPGDISGGRTWELDKGGLKRDVDSLLNP